MGILLLQNQTIDSTANVFSASVENPQAPNKLVFVVDVGTATAESFSIILQMNIDADAGSGTPIGWMDLRITTTIQLRQSVDGVLLAQTDGNFTTTTAGIVTTSTGVAGVDKYILEVLNPPVGHLRLKFNGQSGSTVFVIDSVEVSP